MEYVSKEIRDWITKLALGDMKIRVWRCRGGLIMERTIEGTWWYKSCCSWVLEEWQLLEASSLQKL